MPFPIIRGVIDRRILVNYRVDPDVLARILPAPFRPKLVNGMGMAGVCLIRLKHIRPRFLPAFLGISSENAAHRIAVEWDQDGEKKEGVFIPRRDTSSWLNTLAGGRLFPESTTMLVSRSGKGTIISGLPWTAMIAARTCWSRGMSAPSCPPLRFSPRWPRHPGSSSRDRWAIR